MRGLKCTCTNCEFNKLGGCDAGIINISSNAVCKTKIKKHDRNIDEEYRDMEVGESFDFDDTRDVLIECDSVKCKYNKNHICEARNVTIEDTLLCTKCATKCVR